MVLLMGEVYMILFAIGGLGMWGWSCNGGALHNVVGYTWSCNAVICGAGVGH